MNASEIKELLKSYSVCKKFIDSQEYARTYFDPTDTQKVDKKEEYEARMLVIESLIQLLEPSNEYTFLHLHYIKGVPVEKCAESMGLSRRTGFRMLKKAHQSIYDLLSKRGQHEQREADRI